MIPTTEAYHLSCPQCQLSRQARFDEKLPESCGKCHTRLAIATVRTPRHLEKSVPFDAWRAAAQAADATMRAELEKFAGSARAYAQSCLAYEAELHERWPNKYEPRYTRKYTPRRSR